MTEKTISANGLELVYESMGDANQPTIILIMGLGTQMIAWPDPFCANLVAKGFHVLRFDNRDIGLSEKIGVKKSPSLPRLMLRSRLGLPLKVPYSLQDMADDTAALMHALNIDSAHIVGASMGGMIGQTLAAHHPQMCLSLTSIMSSSGNPKLPTTSWRITRHMMSKRPSGEKAMLAHAKQLWALIGSPDYPPSNEELETKILRSFRRSFYPKGYQNQVAAILKSGDRRALLKTITCPTLIIHGKADQLVPVECGIDTANNINDAKLVLIEGMGHDFPKQLHNRIADHIGTHIEQTA